jgi:single-strand DNA-binding protein
MAAPARRGHEDTGPVNEVRIRGRLAAASVERILPSGDVVAMVRLVVDRPLVRGARPTAARVDTLDCAIFKADLRRRVARWEPGDILEVEGSLRRRFFRAAGGAASRYEVEVAVLTRVARASLVERATMAG